MRNDHAVVYGHPADHALRLQRPAAFDGGDPGAGALRCERRLGRGRVSDEGGERALRVTYDAKARVTLRFSLMRQQPLW